MKFANKELVIDGNKFSIKYLVQAEDYELQIKENRISISVFYHPNIQMLLSDSENILNRYLDLLKEEIHALISEHQEFYNQFESEYRFTESGSSGGFDDYHREASIGAHAIMYLKLKKSPK